jgi:hypothetical protein
LLSISGQEAEAGGTILFIPRRTDLASFGFWLKSGRRSRVTSAGNLQVDRFDAGG